MANPICRVLILGTLALQVLVKPLDSVGQALPSFAESDQSNNASELTRAGLRYLRGVGVARDTGKALQLYCKAARLGDLEAQYRLGDLYAFGRGVPRDEELGSAWLYRAAQGGDRRAKVTLKVLGVEGKPRRKATCPLASHEAAEPQGGPVFRSHSARPLRLAGSGTGFAVSRQGTLMTARHVVDGCRALRVRRPGSDALEAKVVAESASLDLAVLGVDGDLGEPAPFRQGKRVRPGDPVVVYGFPLPGTLATTGNVTTGTVTALAGVGDDPGRLQISAPVQPGNSGGPLLDLSGSVVGVVSSRLSPDASPRMPQYAPQNVNFATKGTTAAAFLKTHGIAYKSKPPARELKPADVVELARNFTYRVQCYR